MQIRTIKKNEIPEAADLLVAMEGTTPTASVGTAEGTLQWPINSKSSITSVHGINHDDYMGSNNILLKMRATAEKAASHPVTVVATNDQLLYAHSVMREVETTEIYGPQAPSPSGPTTGGVEKKQTIRVYAYETALLPINLEQITPEPLDQFQVVIEMVDTKVGPFKARFPVLWLLPVTGGQLDNSRFGFKIHMQLEQTGAGGFLESRD